MRGGFFWHDLTRPPKSHRFPSPYRGNGKNGYGIKPFRHRFGFRCDCPPSDNALRLTETAPFRLASTMHAAQGLLRTIPNFVAPYPLNTRCHAEFAAQDRDLHPDPRGAHQVPSMQRKVQTNGRTVQSSSAQGEIQVRRAWWQEHRAKNGRRQGADRSRSSGAR